jgi:hypothetical protein
MQVCITLALATIVDNSCIHATVRSARLASASGVTWLALEVTSNETPTSADTQLTGALEPSTGSALSESVSLVRVPVPVEAVGVPTEIPPATATIFIDNDPAEYVDNEHHAKPSTIVTIDGEIAKSDAAQDGCQMSSQRLMQTNPPLSRLKSANATLQWMTFRN